MLDHAGLLVLIVKVTIILLAALGITRTMQRASAGARHLVWLVTLGTLLLVPTLTAWGPISIHVLAPVGAAPVVERRLPAPSAAVGAARTEKNDDMVGRALGPTAVGQVDAFMRPGTFMRSGTFMRAGSLMLAVWALVVLLVVASFAWSGLTVRRIVRHARALDVQAWRTPLLEIADRMGLDEPPRLLVSSHAKMPFACGLVTPTIVLPDECDSWSLDRRRAVLLHELAHVRRKDLLGHMLGRLVCAFYWFHPLVWMAAKRLRSESERACDDLALACGTRATDYAEHLLDIVTSVRRDATPMVALAMARRKEFEGRMLAILDPDLRHSSPSRRQSAALIAALALVGGVVAAVAPAPRAATAATLPATIAAAPAPARAAPLAAHALAVQAAPVIRSSTVAQPATVGPDSEDVTRERRAELHDRIHEQQHRKNREAQQVPAGGDDRPALLAKVLRSDSSAKLRRVAAWGLENYPDVPAAAEALVYAVRHDSDPSVREMAAWTLANYDNSDGVPDALGAAVRGDADERVRATAAWALGTMGRRGGGSPDALVVALSDANLEVRRQAAWALGTIGEKPAPQAIVGMLSAADPESRKLAAWVLFQIEDPATVPALQAALHKEKDGEIQIAELRAVIAMGNESVDAIRELLESPDPEVKSMAVRALAGGHAQGPWPWPWPRPRPFP